jgi:threonine dehydratase
MAITLEEIRHAAELIRGKVVETPCPRSHKLSELTGAQVVLKLENLQFTGSFKDRGALVKLLSLTREQRAAGVIAMSAGNHAQAVAYHAQSLGIPAVIVMPRHTPNVKVAHTRAFGAEVILHGEGLAEAGDFARTLVRERGLHLVHPYDDERIIGGQGTIALEMLSAHPDLDVLVVPVGGGGLISGNAVAAKALRPELQVIGVQAARFPAMLQAMRGEPITCGTATIAEGIAVKQPGRLTLPIVRKLVDDMLLVEEDVIEEAVRLLLETEKTVVEGAGGAGLAAVLKYPHRFVGRKVGLILCGGNIDLLILSSIIQRGLVRSGRLVRLRLEVRDVPGALAEVATLLGEVHANIVEVQHQRAFTSLPLQSAEVEFVLMTRGLDHLQQIIAALDNGGYKPRFVQLEPEAAARTETQGLTAT